MSNYITVRNGLLKRELPSTPTTIEFTNSKGLKYITTLDNGKTRETVEFFGIPVTGATEFRSEGWDIARQRDMEVIYNLPRESDVRYHGGITAEQIRDAMQYVFSQERDSPGMHGNSTSNILAPIEDQPMSQMTVTSNPVLDGDNWTYEVQAHPLTSSEAFESLPDSITRVEDMSADEALRRGLITDIEYLDIISREDDNI